MWAVLEERVVAAARGCGPYLLDFVIRRIGEAQHQMAEVFAEFVLLGQQSQHAHLRGRGRDHEVAVAHKDRSRHFALDGRREAHRAGAQMKRSRLALKVKTADADRLASQRKVAQSLISWIRVRARRRGALRS